MFRLRRAHERGQADYGWLKTNYTFSFSGYYDPEWMHFRSLRVMNDDRVAGHTGFPKHPHDNMEIITYVMDGELEHGDSLGNGSKIRAGEIQMMHAGSGIEHSERNPGSQTVHLYQIWIMPDKKDVEPGYQQRAPLDEEAHNKLALIVSPNADSGSFKIYQDAKLYLSRLDAGKDIEYPLDPNRHAWLQVTKGTMTVNDVSLSEGDGVGISQENGLKIRADNNAEFLLFDLK
jgi:redox-sensitive bicupin YhaK (pirin superfamily)